MKEHYEDRISRLRAVLQDVAAGRLGPLTACSVARKAIDTDAALAERHRQEADVAEKYRAHEAGED